MSIETHPEIALRELVLSDSTIADALRYNEDGAERFRLHPLELPENSPVPAIVYTCISDPAGLTNEGAVALTDSRYQFDIFVARPNYVQLETLRLALKKRLHGFRGTVAGVHFPQIAYLGRNPASDPETAKYRCSVDFNVWFDEP